MPGHDREAAWALLTEYTKTDSLRLHALGVEASMRHAAAQVAPDEIETWGITGLLHDFDYERYPTLGDHPQKGNEILTAAGWPEEIRAAILGHAGFAPRVTPLDKWLFAVDELTGFVFAVTYVRPSKSVLEVEVSSVKKKLKQKAFAASVSREDIYQGAEELGKPLEEVIQLVIDGLRAQAEPLGLAGTPGEAGA